MEFTRFKNGVVVVNIWNDDIVLMDVDGEMRIVRGNNIGLEKEVLTGHVKHYNEMICPSEDFSVSKITRYGTAKGRLKIVEIYKWFNRSFSDGRLVILGPEYVARAYPGAVYYTFQNHPCTRFYAY